MGLCAHLPHNVRGFIEEDREWGTARSRREEEKLGSGGERSHSLGLSWQQQGWRGDKRDWWVEKEGKRGAERGVDEHNKQISEPTDDGKQIATIRCQCHPPKDMFVPLLPPSSPQGVLSHPPHSLLISCLSTTLRLLLLTQWALWCHRAATGMCVNVWESACAQSKTKRVYPTDWWHVLKINVGLDSKYFWTHK